MNPPIAAAAIITASPNYLATTVGERVVILDVPAGVYYGLDAVGAYVWSLIQQPRTVTEVRDLLLEEFDVESAVCMAELQDLLQQLAAKGLIQVNAVPLTGHADV